MKQPISFTLPVPMQNVECTPSSRINEILLVSFRVTKNTKTQEAKNYGMFCLHYLPYI